MRIKQESDGLLTNLRILD